jgi:surface antigen
MLKYFLAVAALAAATPAFADCDTAEVAQQNIQRQRSYAGFGESAANILGRTDLGRSLNTMGFGRSDMRKAGAALGVRMAGPLTRGLDQCDQQWLMGSTTQTLESTQSSSWTNEESGASGQNRVVATPVEVLRANPGKDCRTVEQYIALPDGASRVQNVSACRGADGAWETVN